MRVIRHGLIGLFGIAAAATAGCSGDQGTMDGTLANPLATETAASAAKGPSKPGARLHRCSRAARCARSRCPRTGSTSSPSTRPTTGSRSSASRRSGLHARGSVPVGLEPVAVAARSDDEVWVVNHLSDSVSIVDVERRRQRRASCARCSSATSRATSCSPARAATRAFITTAHRGQNIPLRSAAHHARRRAAPTSGCSTPTTSARSLGGTPLTIVTLFSDTPRALAVTPGRQHASTRPASTPATGPRPSTRAWCPDGGEAAGGVPGPDTNVDGRAAAGGRAHRQVQRQPTGSTSSAAPGTTRSRFSLPDKDVFVIDAMRQSAGAARRRRRLLRAASAPSCSTWRSTR